MDDSTILHADFRYGDFEVKCSRYPADYNSYPGRSNKDDFSLVVLDVKIAVMTQASSKKETAEYEKRYVNIGQNC